MFYNLILDILFIEVIAMLTFEPRGKPPVHVTWDEKTIGYLDKIKIH